MGRHCSWLLAHRRRRRSRPQPRVPRCAIASCDSSYMVDIQAGAPREVASSRPSGPRNPSASAQPGRCPVRFRPGDVHRQTLAEIVRLPSRPRHRAALLTTLVLVAAGCMPGPDDGASSRPRPSLAPVSPPPSAEPSIGAFQAMAWPPDGQAACAQPEPPDPEHDAYRGELRRIVAVDALTVRFGLCEPDVAFRAKLASPALTIDDTAWLQDHGAGPGRSDDLASSANGTGAYRVTAWRTGQDVELARNDGYRGTAPAAAGLVFRWLADPSAQLRELHDSTVDGVATVDPGLVEGAGQDFELQVHPRDGLDIGYLGWNASFAPFDDELVRRALATGIDRAGLVRSSYPPGTEVASYFNPCAIPDGCVGKSWYGFDPLAAKDLLTRAGHGEGFTTTLAYPTTPRDYLPDPAAVAHAIAAQLKANLGITATLQPRPFDDLLKDVDAGKVEGLYLLGSRPRYPDASFLLDSHFGTDGPALFGPTHADIVKALDTASSTVDAPDRTAAYKRANDAIRKHAVMVPLVHVGSTVAYRADVTGVTVSPTGVDAFAAFVPGDRSQFAFMQTAEPTGLACPDATTLDTLRVCAQFAEGLYRTIGDNAKPLPALARSCDPNEDLTVWTCRLQPGVSFHDGSRLDANDVVLSFAIQWDADQPLRSAEGTYQAFTERFGGFLDPPAGD